MKTGRVQGGATRVCCAKPGNIKAKFFFVRTLRIQWNVFEAAAGFCRNFTKATSGCEIIGGKERFRDFHIDLRLLLVRTACKEPPDRCCRNESQTDNHDGVPKIRRHML